MQVQGASKQACKQSRKEKNTSLCCGRKKELKKIKKTTPSIQNYQKKKLAFRKAFE
jgi:hypothetical protein